MSKSVVILYGRERSPLDRLMEGDEPLVVYACDDETFEELPGLPYGDCVAYTVTAVFEDES